MLKSGVGSSMITNNKVDKRIKDLDDIVLYPPLSFFFLLSYLWYWLLYIRGIIKSIIKLETIISYLVNFEFDKD